LDCWSGENVQHIPEASLEAARYDEVRFLTPSIRLVCRCPAPAHSCPCFPQGVVRMYPLLKQLERICDESKIRFPVDHIGGRKSELSVEAITFAFGPNFAEKHAVKATGHLKK